MLKKKTIHAVVKYFYPVAAGIETNMLETYSVLAEKGWNVTIHTSKNTLTETNVLRKKEELRGLNIRRYLWRWFGFIPNISYKNVDVVALHNFNVVPHIFIMILFLFRRIFLLPTPQLLLVPHGGFTPDWEIFSPMVRLFKLLYHRTCGALLINLSVQGIRAVSEWERNEIILYGVSKDIVTVIPNGIEKEGLEKNDQKVSQEMKKMVKQFGKYIIQIGRIYNIKNYETTIRALTNLPKDIHFVIAGPVGDYGYLSKLKKLIAEKNLIDRVHFVGVIRGYDKYFLIRCSQMMVHMARWESFCNVVHEGMSQGKVVLVANNTALRYLVEEGKNGFLIPTHDEKTLAEKINYILEKKNSKKIKIIEKNNYVVTKEQSWRNVALAINDWLRKDSV